MDAPKAGVADLLDELESPPRAPSKKKRAPPGEALDLDIRW